MFVYSSHGKWVFPPLLWNFPPSATLTNFPALGWWACTPASAGASLVHLACLFTVPGRIPFPQSSALSAPHLLSSIVLIAYYSVSHFFPRWRLVCPGGYVALAQGCLCEYRSTAKLNLSMSSQAIWAEVAGGWWLGLAAQGPS
jgi:hypothetical protein